MGAVLRNLAFPWLHVNYTRRPVGFSNDFHLSGAAWALRGFMNYGGRVEAENKGKPRELSICVRSLDD